MAATNIDYGVAHFYGLRNGTSVTYMTVQSDSFTDTFKLDVEVSDVDGRIITDRLDDRYQELTIEGVILASGSIPDNGTQFTYSGVQWIIKSVDDKGTNKDFRKLSIKGIKYSQIA